MRQVWLRPGRAPMHFIHCPCRCLRDIVRMHEYGASCPCRTISPGPEGKGCIGEAPACSGLSHRESNSREAAARSSWPRHDDSVSAILNRIKDCIRYEPPPICGRPVRRCACQCVTNRCCGRNPWPRDPRKRLGRPMCCQKSFDPLGLSAPTFANALYLLGLIPARTALPLFRHASGSLTFIESTKYLISLFYLPSLRFGNRFTLRSQSGVKKASRRPSQISAVSRETLITAGSVEKLDAGDNAAKAVGSVVRIRPRPRRCRFAPFSSTLLYDKLYRPTFCQVSFAIS